MCQAAADLLQRGVEGIRAIIVPVSQRGIASQASRKGEHGVAGRGVAVYGDGVEAARRGHFQHFLKEEMVHGGVGEDIAQHGGHVGSDHARSLDDARQLHRSAADDGRGGSALGECIGGADRQRSIFPTARFCGQHLFQPGLGLVNR